jgi:hypothetical protein
MMRKEVGYCVFSGVAERRVTDVMGKRRRRNYCSEVKLGDTPGFVGVTLKNYFPNFLS